jgi:cyclohexa-1,5-dienecarbonyl-CoA hydratase
MSAAATVHVQREGNVARVTLDRPPLNVLDIATMCALAAALEPLLAPGAGCDFILFHGAGPKGFSAGAEVRDHTPDRVAEMLGAFHGIFLQLARADSLSIAAVHGVCVGGGMELATFCDFVVAEESATFGQPEIKLGCFPPVALVTLPRLVGPRAAMDLILSGRTVAAREALQLGLVSRVVPDGALAASVDALLEDLRQLSPTVLRMCRRALWRSSCPEFERALADTEEFYLNVLMKTADAQEGIRAFLEKRAPAWQGR